jgi:hypothetical protein
MMSKIFAPGIVSTKTRMLKEKENEIKYKRLQVGGRNIHDYNIEAIWERMMKA